MSEKMKILQMIEDGEISLEEGIRLINNLEDPSAREENNEKFSTFDILGKIESGEITADDAVGLLSGSSDKEQNASAEPEYDQLYEEGYADYQGSQSTPPNIPEEELNRWKRWWTYPLYVGVGIVILSTFWLNSAYQNNGFGFWFFCSWVPLTLGLVIISLSWQSRGGPWIHVRVKGQRERVAVSIPAPLGLTSWALRTFGHYIPQLEKTSVDEIIVALESTSKNNAPLYVQVDDVENGEKVEVFIG